MGLLSGLTSGFGLLGVLQDSQNKKAAKKATAAVTAAADKNRALFESIYNQSRNDLAPYNEAGRGALGALNVRMGLAPMSGAAGSATRPSNGAQGAPRPFGGDPRTTPAYGAQDATMGPSAKSYQTTGFGGQKAPAGYYFGPSDQLLPIPGGQGGGTVKPNNNGSPVVGYGATDKPIYGDAASGQPAPYGTTPPPGAAYFNAPGAAPQAAPAAPGSQPDYAAYGAANPDLQAEWGRIQQTGNADGFGNDPNTYYAWHHDTYGQNEGRNLPMTGGPQNAQPQAPADPNAPPDEYYQETYADRPQGMAPPSFQRQGDVQFEDYGKGPQFKQPNWSDIAKDPGFIFETGQAAGGVNANAAARGQLRSGGAAKALQDRLFGVAHTYGNDYFSRAMQSYNAERGAFQDNRNFGNNQSRYQQGRQDTNFLDDRSYGTNLWNTQQNRADNIFSEDRGFAANRNDQATANLFNLTNIGQNAAAGTANAGNTFAGNVAQGNNNVAQTTANGALWRQGQVNNMFGSAMNLAGTFAGGGF
jgi:hypothetical protein